MGLFKKSSTSRLGNGISISRIGPKVSSSAAASPRLARGGPSPSSLSRTPSQAPVGNPNPDNYSVEKHTTLGRFLIVQIHYPDCTNYEGHKILVFENVTMAQLHKQRKIDPHFCVGTKYKHPIARFEPTPRGWNWAVAFSGLQSV